MKNRNRPNRKPIRNSVMDFALLTCGLVDIPVFEKCVEAIGREAQAVESRVHIMLNGLSPESRAPFSQICNTIPGVQFKHSNERLGFGEAANRIIRQCTSPLILFITDDVILHEGSVQKLLETMKDPKIALCGLKLIFPEDSTDPNRPAGRVQHIGHGIDVRGEVTHPLMGWRPDNPKCNVSREVQSVTGGVFIVRRDIFAKSGGFFPGYGIGYFEDVDLCLTIRQIPLNPGVKPEEMEGYRVWINTEATATHYTNMSMTRSGQHIPMDTNKFIFQRRNAGRMVNDSWTFW